MGGERSAVGEVVDAIRAGLAAIASGQPEPPATARRGAVLLLLRPPADEDDPGGLAITYTRRQAHLSSHPGQISFPGGRVDEGEGIVDAALREAAEEVALRPDTVEVLGRLPAFYIPPSRFWMSAVVAVWRAPHPLVPSQAEVAEVLEVDLATLVDRSRWRTVALSAAGATWAWELAPRRLLWGATAVVTGILLDIAQPGWSGGMAPGDLSPELRLTPWEDPQAAGMARPTAVPRPLLRDVSSLQLPRPAPSGGGARDGGVEAAAGPAQREAWARGVAEAVRRLDRRGPGPVVVICGPGTIGAVGRDAAALLSAHGERVVVLDARAGVEPAQLAAAGVVVDAMLGRGLRGLLTDPLLGPVRALRDVSVPIVAVDLPTGIDPEVGLVGESVSADVTVTGHRLVPGHVASGAMPFVADLYVVDESATLRRAAVDERPAEWGE